jgi:transcriptional regulator with XRE-family HTH domain
VPVAFKKHEGIRRRPNLRAVKTMKNATIRYAVTSNIERFMRAGGHNITEAELAARSHIQPSALRSILDGSIDIDVDTLDVIAEALGVSANDLLASPAAPADPLSIYRDRIAALPADQQQRIQDLIDSVMAQFEEQPVH